MKSITQHQYFALMAHLPDSPRGRRDRGLFDLMWHAGLRCSEAVGVRPEHYEPRSGEPYLFVLWGKGNKERYVPIGPTLANAIEAWLASGDRPGVDGPLYPVLRPRKSVATAGALERKKSKPDYQVDTSQLRSTLATLSRQAEVLLTAKVEDTSRPKVDGRHPLRLVRKPIQPHALRHSYAIRLLMNGLSTVEIQQQLGHSELATTERYLQVHDEKRAARVRLAVEGKPVDDRIAAELERAKSLRLATDDLEGVAAASRSALDSMIDELGVDEAMRRLQGAATQVA
ncbi:MAG: tyrosine-type recombinase/integrase [Solirubrobacterales bacterium]|nr:tyrosine-type recombinase/integrase [Solirubrobacterales bacterium]